MSKAQCPELLVEDYIPLRYQQATTDNEIALDWIRSPAGVLYLYGPVGTGKSHTAWAIIRDYIMTSNDYGDFEGGSVNTVLEAMKPG